MAGDLVLRGYQERAVEWVLRSASKRPNARLLIVLPMGGGKTAIAAALLDLAVAKQRTTRGLFTAHRFELLEQFKSVMCEVGIPKTMVCELGDEAPSARIVVSSVDDLRLTKSLPHADIVITDEAHRDAGPFRRKFRASYHNVLRVGFTATPERLDGKALREDYDDMFVAAQPSELIHDGYLLAPKVFTVPADRLPDLRGVRTTKGDFSAADVEKRVNQVRLLGDIVEHWKTKANNRQTLVFACSKLHSQSIVERFKAAGISAAHVDGHTPMTERASILADLASGQLKIASSCELLAEGIDIPEIKCVVMARPTASLVVCYQQAGRCMRPVNGDSTTALILDHVGNIVRHGYPFADREWSLDGVKERHSRGPTLSACMKCHAVVPGKECPECGAVLTPIPPETKGIVGEREVRELPGELVSVAVSLPLETRVQEYNRLRQFAINKGFGERWAIDVYVAKFNEKQPK